MIEKYELMPYKRKQSGQAKALLGSKRIGLFYGTKQILFLSIIGFLLGRASILDGLAPFGIAYFTVLLAKERKNALVGVGIILGTMTVVDAGSWGKYGFALLLSWVVFYFIKDKIQRNVFKTALVSGTIMFLAGILYGIFSDLYIYDLFMIGFESVVTFVFVYILSYAVPIALQKTNRKILSNEELICIAITAAVLISGFADISIRDYALKNVLGILLTLIFAYNGGASVGASVGVTIGIITSMSTIGTPTVIGIYAFSGLLAGIFKDLGKLGSSMGIIMGNAILTFYINGSTEVILQFEEIVMAFIIFMLIPKSILGYTEKFVNANGGSVQLDKAYSERIRRITFDRLKEFSHAFSELAVTYGQILERNRLIDQQEIAGIIDQVVNKVCSQCGMCRSCWKNGFYSSYNDLVEIITLLESSGRIKEDKIPTILKKRCIRLEMLLQTIYDQFEIYKIHYKWENKLFESRQLVAEQFQGVSEILHRLGKEINMDVHFKTDIEDALYVAFDKAGIVVNKITVFEKENGKMEVTVEKRSCYDRKQCDEKIAPIVSQVMGVEFIRKNQHCTTDDSTDNCVFQLVAAEKYRASTGVARASKDNGHICGDSYTMMDLQDGKYMIALSDGMGSGEKAAKESTTTITLLEQLLEAGFDQETAIKTINSILVLKSSDEIFSTIDLSIIDLYTGRLDCIKIGAASSFIKRGNGEIEIIKSTSLPIGILSKIDFDSFGKKLGQGDFVIMMSDGILDADKQTDIKENWVIAALQSIHSRNPQVIADELMNMAIEKYGDRIEDDMTVLVTKIWESK
ncbi:stage II sporulation protein E [Anaerosolibacter carboniphilus]|uniref:Stage II sporulation protein E n=2 Tax=Anaerosolibacter carboniphilus TaxID=1417629 RepID=A0A841L5U2_9FIRM|nr:stage II sporulation protein E [Anaerosolibacter carboniphilus]